LVQKLIDEYRVSIKRAASVCLLARSLFYYKAHGRDDRALRQRIKEIAATRVR
jgi:putative transposase